MPLDTRRLVLAVFLALIALWSAPGAQSPRPFDDLFTDSTMRVDYSQTGGRGIEVVALDRIVNDGPWPGQPDERLVDDTNLGTYLFEVIDRDTNQVIYSRGFAIHVRRVGDDRRGEATPTGPSASRSGSRGRSARCRSC